jgi:catechol 2,3-dioxygenase
VATRRISQLAHVEVATPVPEDSLRFYTDCLGMMEVARDGRSVYLRAWGEWFHHSLVLTEGPQAEILHTGWRASSEDDLGQAAAHLESIGAGEGWHDESLGHGRAYRYRGPGGQLSELFWEVDRFEAPPELRSTFPVRPQKRIPKGATVRQIDHVTVSSEDVYRDAEWHRDNLGFRFMEYAVLDDDPNRAFFAAISTNEQAHDFGLVGNPNHIAGAVHHFAFWLDQEIDVPRAAETLLELDVPIEFGPNKHGHGENTYLYCREPGGMRVELFSGGYRNYQPDWEPVRWTPSQGSQDMYRNSTMPDSLFEFFPNGHSVAAEEASAMNPFKAAPIS